MNAQELKDALDAQKSEMPERHKIRLHRAISWYQCAEACAEADEDLCFLALWVALNCCYAVQDPGPQREERQEERAGFRSFARMLVQLDQERSLYESMWKHYSQFVRALINNQYVFPPFWKAQVDPSEDWERKFEGSKLTAQKALRDSDASTLLSIVFDRLYVLRNQLLHGGATHKSAKNRDQVTNGKRMLMELLPIVIHLMFDHSQDWGPINYPPLDNEA